METQMGYHAFFEKGMRQGDSGSSGDFSIVTDTSAAGKCRYDSPSHPERSALDTCDGIHQTKLASGQREGAGIILEEGGRAHHTKWLPDVVLTDTYPTKTRNTCVG